MDRGSMVTHAAALYSKKAFAMMVGTSANALGRLGLRHD